MKHHQFAHVNVPLEQKICELKQIGFLNHDVKRTEELNELWLLFLNQALPQYLTKSAKQVQLKTFLATPESDLLSYLEQKTVDLHTFYNVGLQLLLFRPGVDFKLSDPLNAMERLGLYHAEKLTTHADLLGAWYDLLCTQTRLGQTLLDHLAGLGYFTKFYDLPAIKKPLFFNGKAQPIFDTSKLIYEVVYIESDLDTDEDGHCDLLRAEVIRPKDTEHGLKVPVLYTASPYHQGTNDDDGKKLLHPADVALQHKTPTTTSKPTFLRSKPKKAPQKRTVMGRSTRAEETFGRETSYSLNDYFLARGFAVVYAAGIGTKGSDGLRTCGDFAETSSTIAIIEWLTGKRKAFTNRTENIELKAWWCNKKAAMTGKSYLGTLAIAAATTGVAGLETIIAEAAISSWYDYYRADGLVVFPDGFIGEDADVLAQECLSMKQDFAKYREVRSLWKEKRAQLTQELDEASGNYNAFWDARNYLNDAHQIKCDLVLIHGLNDQNVKPKNPYQLLEKVADLPVAKKVVLHQGQHIYINNLASLDLTDMLNLWLSHKLYGLDNQAKESFPDLLVQQNTAPDAWVTPHTWGSEKKQTFTLTSNNELSVSAKRPFTCEMSFADQLDHATFAHYTNDLTKWHDDLVNHKAPLNKNSLRFVTETLTSPLTINGMAKLKVRIASSADHGLLSAMLVDLGEAKRLQKKPTLLATKALNCGFRWREDDLVGFTYGPKTSYQIISKGHINLQNRTAPWQNDELFPGTFYDVELALQPTFYTVPQGRKLALIIYATDLSATLRGNEALTYTLARDSLNQLILPLE